MDVNLRLVVISFGVLEVGCVLKVTISTGLFLWEFVPHDWWPHLVGVRFGAESELFVDLV